MSLTIEGIHLVVGDRRILAGASFVLDAPAGVVTISGPSGSGKTLFLETIGGFRTPNEGIVQVSGRRATSPDFTWVPQRPILFPELSVHDNVALAGRFRTKRRGAVDTAIASVALSERSRDRAGRLSGGEAQRACLARCAVADAPVVLADEPTGQLDADATELVIAAITTIAADKVVVIVTHDPVVAAIGALQLRLSGGLLEPVT